MKFHIEAVWTRPHGRSEYVNDIFEGDSACEAVDNATPGQWSIGEFTGANITIKKIQE